MPGRPLDVLEETIGEPVTVTLKEEEPRNGVLGGYDQHLNLVLDPTDGGVDNTTIIRGDNVVSVQA